MSDSSNNGSGKNRGAIVGGILKAGAVVGVLFGVLSHLGHGGIEASEDAVRLLTHGGTAASDTEQAVKDLSRVHLESTDEMLKYSELRKPPGSIPGPEDASGGTRFSLITPSDLVLASRVAQLLSRSQVLHQKLTALSNNPNVPIWKSQELEKRLDDNDAALQKLKDQATANPNDSGLEQQFDQKKSDQDQIEQSEKELESKYG